MILTYCDVCGTEIREIYSNSIPTCMPPPIGDPVSGEFSYKGYYGKEVLYNLCGSCTKKVLDKIKGE